MVGVGGGIRSTRKRKEVSIIFTPHYPPYPLIKMFNNNVCLAKFVGGMCVELCHLRKGLLKCHAL